MTDKYKNSDRDRREWVKKLGKGVKDDVVCLLTDAGLPDPHSRLIATLVAGVYMDISRIANALEGLESEARRHNDTQEKRPWR